jgi:hypothetical protein
MAIIGFLMAGCGDPSDGPTGGGGGGGVSPVSDPVLIGMVSISGTAQVGQTLTADTSDLDGIGSISYQWKAGTTNIGTNSDEYEIVADDIGSSITVTVTRAGYSGSVTSQPTAFVTDPSLSALTGTVSISGTAVTGQTLTANTGFLGGSGTISYQWKRDSTVIGTNSNTYVLQIADAGSTITVTVTRTENSGSKTSSPTAAVILLPLTGTVSISGNAIAGQTLTALTTSLGGSGAITYQWKRSGTDIGTNSSTYVVQTTDAGSTITVTVTRAENSGSVTSPSTATVILPPLTGTVSISGSAYVGQTLTAVTTSLGGSGTITYQWKRAGVDIAGANINTFSLTEADVGSAITITVTRADNSGSVSATTATVTRSALSGSVSITGTPIAGQTLTAVTASLGGSGAISYQWKKGGADIIGANGSTYVLQITDAGSTITVTVTRADNSGSVTSPQTAVVTLPALSGTVSIDGTAVAGQTLTANTAVLGGGGTISYQWKRGATNVGANSNTYVVQTADANSTITITVTRAENSGSVTSAPTVTVTLPPLSGEVTINGNAYVGQTLTANTASLITSNGNGAITYQWKRNPVSGTAVNIGTNSSTYSVVAADIGFTITVTVTRAGYSGSVASATTASVIRPPLSGTVNINGTVQVGQILTAVTTSLGGSGTIGYQWKRGDTNVGTNSSTYAVTAADLGATITVTVTRADNSGNVTSPATAAVVPAVINIAAIPGVNLPVTRGIPVTAITETAQYTGTVAWNGNPATFEMSSVYTATITLTAKQGYTLQGVGANFFTVNGATNTSNAANSGVITAVFPETTEGATFTITFAGITDAAPLIIDQSISRSGIKDPKTVTLTADTPAQYSSIEWRVTGTSVSGTGANFILNSANAAYNSIGEHFLSVEVWKNGKPYNKTITFTVTE